MLSHSSTCSHSIARRRPRIGITSGTIDRWKEHGDLWQTLKAAVEDGGGEAVWLGAAQFPDPDPSLMREALNALDGLLLPGGADVVPQPGYYTGLPDPADPSYSARLKSLFVVTEPDRDAYELPLLREALALDMPILGICRGFQCLNIACGGCLIPDLRLGLRHRAYSEPVSSAHLIRFVSGSRVERMEGGGELPINSRHHQGVTADLVAPGLEPTAFAPDGVVEVLEDPRRPWRWAVQWHPERPEESRLHERDRVLFRGFVDDCKRR